MSTIQTNGALQSAQEYGGFDLDIARKNGTTCEEVREYFTVENFASMFGAEQADDCGGYPLDDCADAIISELGI